MKPFITGHEELIHDIQYDYYGRHLATGSSDQHIKVFDLDSASNSWVLNDAWKAHDSVVVKVAWAHPQFCSAKLLASCSYDRTVKVWQEQPDELQGSGRRWLKVCTLNVESYGPIYDVVFAPPHLGLKLGCVGSDGVFRIYESLEPADLSNWTLTTEIAILNQQLPSKTLQSSFSVEWCPAKFTKTEKFIVVALDQGFVYSSVSESKKDEHTVEEEVDESSAKYVKICNLPDHNGLIRSVSWAPSMGRGFHLIATGCKDGYVRIFKGVESPTGDLKFETLAKLNDHKGEVWRLKWNLTGTILSSAGDDGKVRLWKSPVLPPSENFPSNFAAPRLNSPAEAELILTAFLSTSLNEYLATRFSLSVNTTVVSSSSANSNSKKAFWLNLKSLMGLLDSLVSYMRNCPYFVTVIKRYASSSDCKKRIPVMAMGTLISRKSFSTFSASKTISGSDFSVKVEIFTIFTSFSSPPKPKIPSTSRLSVKAATFFSVGSLISIGSASKFIMKRAPSSNATRTTSNL